MYEMRSNLLRISYFLKKSIDIWLKCAIIPLGAGVAHPVERHLAKVEVASSSLVTRSKKSKSVDLDFFIYRWLSKYFVLKKHEFCDKLFEKEMEGCVVQISDDQVLNHIADLFKAFADPTRVHILSQLLDHELCVNDISAGVELSQSAVSHQLRILKQMHLVKCRRDGKNILYSLADEHVLTILQMGLAHAKHTME